MKVGKILISVLACSITFLSCSSTKQSEYSYGDSYYDSTEDINETDEIKGDKIVTSDNKNSIKKKKANSFFSFGNKDDFIIGDEFTLFTKGTFGGITQKDAQFMISVDDLNSGFGSAYMAAYYIKRLVENQEENISMGKAAREVALVRHDKQAIVENLLKIYDEITMYNK